MPFPSEEEVERLLALPPPLPLPPSSLHLPPPVPTSPLPPLPASLSIPPPVDRREDTLEAELPPRKRLCMTALTSRYEVGESSTVTPRPAGGHGIDYGFIGTLDAETKRQRAEEDRQTQLFQRVDGLVEDGQFHYETARLLDQEALISREACTHSIWLSSTVHYELQAYRTHTQMDSYQQHWDRFRRFRLEVRLMQMIARALAKNMPPKRSSATARAVAAAAAAAAPMTAAAVEQLIKERVSAALANHETL
ncbi:hypothetical protein Tco_0836834 [Tanacetum coccineum]